MRTAKRKRADDDIAPSTMTAAHIQTLLAARHAEDVYVGECKNGPSWSSGGDGLLILDGWALCKTWTPWTTVGYEIKVARPDWEQDQKWPGYLPYCHLFYIVCPAGLVRAVDLPPGVGLLWASQNGERLHVKVRPERHAPDAQKILRLMSYVLMSRTVVVAGMGEANRGELPPTEIQRLAQMHDAVSEAQAKHDLAYFVRGHVATVFAESHQRVEQAERKEQEASRFANHLARLGIVWDPSATDWRQRCRVEDEIAALSHCVDEQVLREMRHAAHALTAAVEAVEKLRRNATGEAA